MALERTKNAPMPPSHPHLHACVHTIPTLTTTCTDNVRSRSFGRLHDMEGEGKAKLHLVQ